MICNALDPTYEFHEGDNIIEFTPNTAGEISYSCCIALTALKLKKGEILKKAGYGIDILHCFCYNKNA